MKTEKLASLSTEDLQKTEAWLKAAGESPFGKYWLKALNDGVMKDAEKREKLKPKKK